MEASYSNTGSGNWVGRGTGDCGYANGDGYGNSGEGYDNGGGYGSSGDADAPILCCTDADDLRAVVINTLLRMEVSP